MEFMEWLLGVELMEWVLDVGGNGFHGVGVRCEW